MRLVAIVWHDAHADVTGEWRSLDDHDDVEPYEVLSVGLLLERDGGGKPGHVSVAQSITPGRMIDYVTHIPEAMVVNILTLHEIGDHDGTTVLDQIRSVARTRVPSTRRRARR